MPALVEIYGQKWHHVDFDYQKVQPVPFNKFKIVAAYTHAASIFTDLAKNFCSKYPKISFLHRTLAETSHKNSF